MRKILSVVLCALLILALAFTTVPYSSAQDVVSLLWSDPMSVNDVAVSNDGNYIVAVNSTGIYYFAFYDPNPIWWYVASGLEHFKSVAISGDGSYVVVGDNIDFGYIYYFADADEKSGLVTEPTWMSVNLYGSVIRGTLDMSDDGEYVVAGVMVVASVETPVVYYFADCTERSGIGQGYDWTDNLEEGEILAVDMSSDGKYVAAGGDNSGGFVVFYKDADQDLGADREPNWAAWSGIVDIVRDIAVSDDGYAVVAVADPINDHALYYWADATNLSDDPDATWTNDGSYGSVDMSSDGNEVVAGTTSVAPCGVHFWSNARFLSGLQDSSWNRHEGEEVLDVAISDDGGIIAATTVVEVDPGYEWRAYFFTSNGSEIGEFELQTPGEVVSMSGDGSIVAIGGPSIDSLSVFRLSLPVGGELIPVPILNTIVLLILIAIIPALAIGFKLIKK